MRAPPPPKYGQPPPTIPQTTHNWEGAATWPPHLADSAHTCKQSWPAKKPPALPAQASSVLPALTTVSSASPQGQARPLDDTSA